ncbi:MAG TPA: chromate transporter [Bacillota bacterium]|nr:chromate transporter [Bacillota bacterium]HOH10853.1 chromate transporter [Bacillota bacterium]HOY88641.1 chromate transporter [Bacillota bacterium]HPI00798.1 chromate transporter [Bacillota bacterium]HPM63981.1 chromate transporter [Bacillota bacterium]
MELLIDIFMSFAKVGLFTFGGGYAALRLIQSEIIISKAWLTMEEFLDVVAIAEVTPGPIALNASTFIGYKLSGIPGAIVGTVGVIFFPVLIMLVLTYFVNKLKDNKKMKAIKTMLRAVVIGLIASAAYTMGAAALGSTLSLVIFAAALAAVILLKADPILLLLVTAVVGAIIRI